MSTNFEDAFRAALGKLKDDAKAAGMSMNALCKTAGVARATPERWKAKPPRTIQLVARMQDIVEQAASKDARTEAAE